MKDIVLALFMENGYEFHFGNDDMYVLKHRVYDDFWIVMDYRENLMEIQPEILSFVSKQVLGVHKSAEKNISMIIPMKVNAITDSTKQMIIDIEDDPFCFKKYVIAYTDDDLKEAAPMIDPTSLADILMEKSSFVALQSEIEDFSSRIGKYHLLYMLAHKLPFLMINVTPKSSDTLVNHFIPKGEKQQEMYEWAINVNPECIEQELIEKHLKHMQ